MAKRGKGRPFLPGASGNPGGRPRAFKQLRLAILDAGADVEGDLIRAVLAISQDREHREQLGAIKFLAGYLWGNPATRAAVDEPNPDADAPSAGLVTFSCRVVTSTGLPETPSNPTSSSGYSVQVQAPSSPSSPAVEPGKREPS